MGLNAAWTDGSVVARVNRTLVGEERPLAEVVNQMEACFLRGADFQLAAAHRTRKQFRRSVPKIRTYAGKLATETNQYCSMLAAYSRSVATSILCSDLLRLVAVASSPAAFSGRFLNQKILPLNCRCHLLASAFVAAPAISSVVVVAKHGLISTSLPS